MRALVPFLLSLFVTFSITTTATAETRSGARGGDGQLQELLDRLKALIAQGEKERAADRYFLRDLRDLVHAYDRPWRVELIHDDFRDGDYARAPAWKVTEGRFRVDRLDGLYSAVRHRPAEPGAQGGREEGADLAMALLGTLLDKQGRREAQTKSPNRETGRAAIHTSKSITAAFAIRVELQSLAESGHLEIGPYTKAPGGPAYHLAYRPGSRYPLELVRIGQRGSSVIESYDKPLKPGRHGLVLDWTRGDDGTMVVAANGKPILRTKDRGLRGGFKGLEIVNLEGEFAVREVTVYGVQR